MVGETGFEPATPHTPCECATRLRHTPTEREMIAKIYNLVKGLLDHIKPLAAIAQFVN